MTTTPTRYRATAAAITLSLLLAMTLGGYVSTAAAQPAGGDKAAPATPEPKTTQATAAKRVRNVAIFVKNHAGKQLDDKVDALQDLVATRITDMGFSVISREEAVNAVAAFAATGANAGKAGAPGADLDAVLSNETSALRLAANMNADYVFTVAISTFGQSTKAFAGNGVETNIVESKMRVSYKILDKFIGGTLGGDTVTALVKTRSGKNLAENTDIINDLLDDAAQQLAQSLGKKVEEQKIREVAGDSSMAALTVACGVQGMVIPDVVRTPAGEYVIASHTVSFEPSSTVELNGVVIGTAPGTFSVPKGLSKIRVSREGCRDWERTISVTADQKLSVDLQMTDEGFARWKEATGFLADLKAGAKISDARVKVLEGTAKMLRQSGYKVNIKVDTKEGLKVQNQARDISIFE